MAKTWYTAFSYVILSQSDRKSTSNTLHGGYSCRDVKLDPYIENPHLLFHVGCKTHPWASCQIRKIAGCACAGDAGNVLPRGRFQRNPPVNDPGMHHGTCVTHVPWYMSGSLNRGGGEKVHGIPSACAPAILRIWQEAHVMISTAVQLNRHWSQGSISNEIPHEVLGVFIFLFLS